MAYIVVDYIVVSRTETGTNIGTEAIIEDDRDAPKKATAQWGMPLQAITIIRDRCEDDRDGCGGRHGTGARKRGCGDKHQRLAGHRLRHSDRGGYRERQEQGKAMGTGTRKGHRDGNGDNRSRTHSRAVPTCSAARRGAETCLHRP